MANNELDKIIDTICELIKGYSQVYRKTTQPFVWADLKSQNGDLEYDPESVLIRERLVEHVGSLPIVATTLYPYINDPEVSLGDTLIMLAIHDIGELKVGDEIAFKKNDKSNDLETKEALSMLDPIYHDYYNDIENLSTKTGKFAKAVDKITGDIFDYLTPLEINLKRFKHYMNIEKDQIVDLFLKHKRPYMLWNPFMEALHIRLIERLKENIEKF